MLSEREMLPTCEKFQPPLKPKQGFSSTRNGKEEYKPII